ncbi:MAG: universal stress protein [Proteiniphilum sp.]|jgi:nucleotide-binding universal stress UspA family protein|nr:universal stress protein [Proteiniphilum sp.]MDD3554974.1 universal stress protein [Proteiniphilum sp.]MDD3978787.1 universal stress protein [Proteiniphilum sp.]MDD5344944.1 universal stress protein [Proteiniphilum sp.]NCD13654.1 universal stress protein [Bacteroidia bacterium]
MEKDHKNHDEKMVTVAIHTYDKAHILKTILESEGIPAVIHGVRMIEPVVPGNVRVRINESDLPRALKIIEELDFTEQDDKMLQRENKKEILVPVDFSDFSLTACAFAFRLAYDLDCEVKLMHVFFTPFYPASVPFGDSFAIQPADKTIYQDVKSKTEKEMQQLVARIKEQVTKGILPDVPFHTQLVEGLPEEEVISYSKKIRPTAIVMGTRGRNAKELDLIGSVTAEVMDGSRTPVFAIPEGTQVQGVAQMKTIVFLTNFQEREFKAFDIMMQFLKPYQVKVYLAHIAKKEDVWNEIKLSGIQKRFAELYPHLVTEYRLIDQNIGLEESLEKFVKEHQIDMISLSSSRRNIFARMFNPGIARRMLFHSDTPLLVIKGM